MPLKVDCAVQTNGQEQKGLIQISSSLDELLQRISAYQRYKRFQLDVSNHAEFFHNQTEVTCARTDTAYYRRSRKVRSNSVKVVNEKGPLGKPLMPLEQFQRSLLREQTYSWDKCAVNAPYSLLHLPKRVSNIEQFLSINQGCGRPRDLLARIAQLEMKLLAIEGQSDEYNDRGEKVVGNKSLPLPNIE